MHFRTHKTVISVLSLLAILCLPVMFYADTAHSFRLIGQSVAPGLFGDYYLQKIFLFGGIRLFTAVALLLLILYLLSSKERFEPSVLLPLSCGALIVSGVFWLMLGLHMAKVNTTPSGYPEELIDLLIGSIPLLIYVALLVAVLIGIKRPVFPIVALVVSGLCYLIAALCALAALGTKASLLDALPRCLHYGLTATVLLLFAIGLLRQRKAENN